MPAGLAAQGQGPHSPWLPMGDLGPTYVQTHWSLPFQPGQAILLGSPHPSNLTFLLEVCVLLRGKRHVRVTANSSFPLSEAVQLPAPLLPSPPLDARGRARWPGAGRGARPRRPRSPSPPAGPPHADEHLPLRCPHLRPPAGPLPPALPIGPGASRGRAMPPGRAGAPRLLLIHWLWRGGARSGSARLGSRAASGGAAVATAQSGRRAGAGAGAIPRRLHPARLPLSAASSRVEGVPGGLRFRLGRSGASRVAPRPDVPGAGKRGEGTTLRRGMRERRAALPRPAPRAPR